MEELIEKMKVEGKDIHGNKTGDNRESASPRMPELRRDSTQTSQTSDNSRSQRDFSEIGAEYGSTRFLGTAFFRSLTDEVRLTLSVSFRFEQES